MAVDGRLLRPARHPPPHPIPVDGTDVVRSFPSKKPKPDLAQDPDDPSLLREDDPPLKGPLYRHTREVWDGRSPVPLKRRAGKGQVGRSEIFGLGTDSDRPLLTFCERGHFSTRRVLRREANRKFILHGKGLL